MVKKINALKRPQKAVRDAAANNYQIKRLTAAVYLAQLRRQSLKGETQPAPQQLAIHIQGNSQVPRPVKIIHAGSIQDTRHNGEGGEM